MVEKKTATVCQATQASEIHARPVKLILLSRKAITANPSAQTAIRGSAGTFRFQVRPSGESTDQGSAANRIR